MLRKQLDKLAPLFEKGGKLEKLYPIYEATDTLLYTPGEVTRSASHVRDGIDQKRMMVTVIVALVPCMLMAIFNTGYQAHLAVSQGAKALEDWQTSLYLMLGFAADDLSLLACVVHGALYFLPVYAVTMVIGGHSLRPQAVISLIEIPKAPSPAKPKRDTSESSRPRPTSKKQRKKKKQQKKLRKQQKKQPKKKQI